MEKRNDGVGENIDLSRRFVRITGEKLGNFIEFEYAIGEPDLFIEMILDRESFKEFCQKNNVEVLSDTGETSENSDWNWRLSDARQVRFKP